MPDQVSSDRVARLRAALPDEPTRDEIEAIIIERATNDGALWAQLVNPATTAAGLARIFGAPPPPGVNVKVVAEDAQTFFHVVPSPEVAEVTVGSPTLAPRRSFRHRLNYLLHTDAAFKQQFEQHPQSAIAGAFQFRFPTHVQLTPLKESSTTTAAGDPQYNLYVVLPYSAHDALFDSPYALRFNGRDALVAVPFSPSLDFEDALTVETWFKADAYQPGNWQDAVVSMHGEATGWELRVGGAVPRFLVTLAGRHYYAQPTDPTPFLRTGVWYYLVGVYNRRQLQLWLDGRLLYTTDAQGGIDLYRKRVTLGGNSNPAWTGRFFAGEIDEVRIWSRARAQAEIVQYRPRKSRGTPPAAGDPDLRAYYPMSEGNGATLPDHSGFDNTGAIERAEWVTIPENAP